METLRRLPGIGPRSAQRMAHHLLERDREGALALAQALETAVSRIGRCGQCRTLAEEGLCALCANTRRDPQVLCVVETPMDLDAIEQATGFGGRYFVLGGHLSPIDGIGPEALGLGVLEERLRAGEVRELILATNPTVEGEATAHYIATLAHDAGIGVTRLAHGVPLGGELEHLDSGTLAHAFRDRRSL